MKKKWIIIGVAALIILGLLTWLVVDYAIERKEQKEKDALKNAFGFHIVDGKLYARLYGDCFIFDSNGQAVDSYLSCQGAEGDDNIFAGDLAVMGFEPPEDGYITHEPLVQRWENGIYTIFDHPNCRHNEPDENGLSTWVTHTTRYAMTYLMREDDPEFLAVQIYDQNKYTYHVAILAQTEEEARAGWKWFDENRPDGLA
jgi:hypothetical protein